MGALRYWIREKGQERWRHLIIVDEKVFLDSNECEVMC